MNGPGVLRELPASALICPPPPPLQCARFTFVMFAGNETGSFVSRLFDKIHADKDKVVNDVKSKKSAKAEVVKSAGSAAVPTDVCAALAPGCIATRQSACRPR